MLTAPPPPTGTPEAAATEAAGTAGLATVELALGGMHCASCATRIQRTLGKQPGVVSAAVNLATNKAFVTYRESSVGSAELCRAVGGIGYTAAPVDAAGAAGSGPEASEHWVARALFAWALSVTALLLSFFAPQIPPVGWTLLALAVLVEVGGGWPFLRTSAALLRHGAVSMDTLIAVGTLAALAVTATETIAFGGRHVHLGNGDQTVANLHSVMGPLIIAVLATGRAVEARARGRAARAMHSLLELRPPVARVVRSADDEQGELVPPESVPAGALVRVRPGETVPLDGTVLAGWSAVDESMLTGEPLPADRGPGSQVTGGTRNGEGALVVRVTVIAAESVLTRLQRLVEEAQREKAPLQRLADRVSGVFVPAILGGSIVTFLAWWLAAGNFGQAVLSGIALLLVACPCAMGLATPVAMMVGCGRASSLGILIRSPDALERLARAEIVVFDKTGTLTEHEARVTAVVPAAGRGAADVLALAQAVERESAHPIAVAVREAGAEVAGEPPARLTVSEVRDVPGAGVEGIVGGRRVSVGRAGDGAAQAELAPQLAARIAAGETAVAVTEDGELAGVLTIRTPPRPEAAGAIRRLHELGMTTAILSGDGEPAVRAVADELGIDRYTARLTPAGKLEGLQQLSAGGQRVVMVGDGVNDAPALAAADVGCAIGSGTEAAIANSDVALLRDDLNGVPAAAAIARSTLAVIQQNFGWAMGYNLAAIPLAAAGLLDPLVAALAMGCSSLVVVLNGLRLARLGRGGTTSVRAPKRVHGVRRLVLSVLVPVVLFAGLTVGGEAISPARGQSLLGGFADITSFNLPGGALAQVYLGSSQAGYDAFHLVVYEGYNFVATTGTSAVATGPGGAPERIPLYPLSAGHYIGYLHTTPGTWTFKIQLTVAGHTDRFTVTRHLS